MSAFVYVVTQEIPYEGDNIMLATLSADAAYKEAAVGVNSLGYDHAVTVWFGEEKLEYFTITLDKAVTITAERFAELIAVLQAQVAG